MAEIILKPHQRACIDFIKQHPYCGIFAEMGTGKTLCTLTALYELNEPGHVLVVAPGPVARATWPHEINQFGFPFRYKSLIEGPRGGKLSREKRLARYTEVMTDPPTMYFINRELFADLVKNLPRKKGLIQWPFATVILDEAQAFKNPRSQRHKEFMKVRPAMRRVIELTGTPQPNSLDDIWGLIHMLDYGARLYPRIKDFHDAWFEPVQTMNSKTGQLVTTKHRPRHKGIQQMIYDRIADITVRYENIASLMPDVTFNDVPIVLDDATYNQYEEFSRDAVIDVAGHTLCPDNPDAFDPNDFDPEALNSVIADNKAVLLAKQLQMASGTLYLSDEGERIGTVEMHSEKLEALLRIIESTPSPVLVAYYFRYDRDRILDYLDANSIEAVAFNGKSDMVDSWNAGKYRVMLLHPASAGHGLNLQHGGHTLVWYTAAWSLENYLQCNARLARQGQKHPVIIHRLVTMGTVDTDVYAALDAKEASQQRLFDTVRGNFSAYIPLYKKEVEEEDDEENPDGDAD